MKKYTDAVHEFHTAFGLGIKNEPTADLGAAKNLLRFNLMKEENEEYLEAANATSTKSFALAASKYSSFSSFIKLKRSKFFAAPRSAVGSFLIPSLNAV